MTSTDQIVHIAFKAPARVILQERSNTVYAATGRFVEGPAFVGSNDDWRVFRTKQIFTAAARDIRDGVTATSISIDIHVSLANIASVIAIKEPSK